MKFYLIERSSDGLVDLKTFDSDGQRKSYRSSVDEWCDEHGFEVSVFYSFDGKIQNFTGE